MTEAEKQLMQIGSRLYNELRALTMRTQTGAMHYMDCTIFKDGRCAIPEKCARIREALADWKERFIVFDLK